MPFIASVGLRMDMEESEPGTRLVLPCDNDEEWAYVEEVLARPIAKLADLDVVLTAFDS